MSFARMDAKYANEVAPEIRMAGIRASEQGKTWDIIKRDFHNVLLIILN